MDKMPDIINGFTHTEYLTVFNAIIFGYVGAEYFQGWGTLIRNRNEIKSYWQHILWTIFAFTMFIQNWWGIWPRTAFIADNLFYFFYSLVPIFIFHIVSVILFPDFKTRQNITDMKAYFYDNSRWLFGVLAVYFLFTISSSFVYKDSGDVNTQNFIRGFGVVLALTAAYFHRSIILHIIFLIIGYAALIRFFMALPT